MIRSIFSSSSKDNALNELLEVISKGIELLSKDNINQGIFDAWKRYAISALELVDTAFNTSYSINFSYENNMYPLGLYYSNPFNGLAPRNSLSDLDAAMRFPTTSIGAGLNFSRDNGFKDTLQKELQKLIYIAKRLPKE